MSVRFLPFLYSFGLKRDKNKLYFIDWVFIKERNHHFAHKAINNKGKNVVPQRERSFLPFLYYFYRNIILLIYADFYKPLREHLFQL